MFTIASLAEEVTGGNMRAMRKLLVDAGADLDEYSEDGAETVSREIVMDLFALRAAGRAARKLVELLRGGQEE